MHILWHICSSKRKRRKKWSNRDRKQMLELQLLLLLRLLLLHVMIASLCQLSTCPSTGLSHKKWYRTLGICCIINFCMLRTDVLCPALLQHLFFFLFLSLSSVSVYPNLWWIGSQHNPTSIWHLCGERNQNHNQNQSPNRLWFIVWVRISVP